MSRWVRMNSPMAGSSVKPFTPSPVDMTIVVAGPYSAYPAETSWLPGRRMSSTEVGLSLLASLW